MRNESDRRDSAGFGVSSSWKVVVLAQPRHGSMHRNGAPDGFDHSPSSRKPLHDISTQGPCGRIADRRAGDLIEDDCVVRKLIFSQVKLPIADRTALGRRSYRRTGKPRRAGRSANSPLWIAQAAAAS